MPESKYDHLLSASSALLLEKRDMLPRNNRTDGNTRQPDVSMVSPEQVVLVGQPSYHVLLQSHIGTYGESG